MKRPPIVTVLGHVDHGKTTLLDTLRKSSVAAGEAGGITQNIGSSVIQTPNGNNITFIDTPGHAAFSKMRSRGAKVADITLLIVAADDGIKPQTREAMEIIKEANIPFIVVATKIDVNGANPEMVRSQLEAEGILFEGRGGDTPFIPVSARNSQGVDKLIEMIELLADVNGYVGEPNAQLESVVIESFKDKRGVVANIVVRNGSLKVGDEVTFGKIRALFDEKGKSIKEVLPGYPAQVIGFSEVPEVGSLLLIGKTEKVGFVASKVLGTERRLKDDELPLLIKASNAGSLEAIIAALPEKVVVTQSGIGDVNESDVLTAKVGNARIFAFDARIPNSVLKLAEAEGVRVKRFEIIYELLQEIDEIFKKGRVEILGKAEVLASFPFNNKKVAGCKVTDGKIAKAEKVILLRGDKEIGKAKIVSLKKQKLEVTIVGAGEEFGIILEPQLDFIVGDVIASVAR